ncbi:hypothetical protein FIBSPDRAFT_1053137 [Athelia psychrophila]|uniref:Uncharacterized protein n=1 Tax=Athelia psychrophila TaxID=1759441 RepID=A0A167XEE2_9AGAM|nr:hypothetical protein FIBSPDRAFT_1053137 [Fibularhizoctonia sp. CBS 109695]
MHNLLTSELYTIPNYPSTVKIEPNDDGFIQDISHLFGISQPQPFEHLVPPSEVPLRATGATKDMRKLMSVFRLNPFSIHHNSGRGVSVPLMDGERAGPLTEEPRYINFQLNGGYSTEDVECQSHGELPRREIQILEGGKGMANPWAGSDDAGPVPGWQSPEWSLDEPRPLSPHASPCLEVAYTDAMSMWLSSGLDRDAPSYYSYTPSPGSASPVDTIPTSPLSPPPSQRWPPVLDNVNS